MNLKKTDIKMQERRSPISKSPRDLLENWQIWMAIEVVEQWLEASPSLKQSDILNSFDLLRIQNDSFNLLFQRLIVEIEQSKELNNSLEDIDKLRNYLLKEYYQNNILLELQQTNHNIRKEKIEVLHQLVSTDYQQASPVKLSLFLQDFVTGLVSQRNHLEQEKIKYLKKEISAWQAFFNLCNKLNNSVKNSIEYLCIKECVWNSLLVSFESKLKVDTYTSYSQTLLDLIHSCRSYYDSVNLSAKKLEEIQTSLKQKCTLELISLPIFTELKRVNSGEQKKLIEIWVGHSLNYWGNSPVSWQQIEAELLKNIEPLIIELYKDIHHYFKEHLKAI